MRVVTTLLSAILLFAILGVAGVGYVFYHFGRDLPDYHQLADYEPPVTTRLYAGDGRLLTEYAVQSRTYVPIEVMPRWVIDAFLSAEDKNFYSHSGLDFTGVARAAITNLQALGSGRRPQGASTITQQVAKNFLLSNEVSYQRKIREAILAVRIEQTYSKDYILELYLNEIYLGFGAYGVSSAAMNYFNKSLDQLTLAEAAFLAALPKAPNNYHPIRRHDTAVERRNWVISRMRDDGHISAVDAEAAMAEPLVVRSRDETEFVQGGEYFAEEVRREIMAVFGEQQLYSGGLAVRTTLDPTLQAVADRALRDGLIVYDRRHGWRGPLAHLAASGTEALIDSLGQIERPIGVPDAWSLAVVTEVTAEAALVALAEGADGHIPLAELRWARPWVEEQRLGAQVSQPADALSVGDVVLVERLIATAEGEDLPEGTYGLRQIPDIDGALIAMDPHTGRILAMSGGFSYERSEFNRATQALRQPGSAFKPFVYLAALEQGYTPSTLVLDAPFVYDQGPGLPRWRPRNYSREFYGPTTLRVGLEKSRNLMTVRLAQAVGMEQVARKARDFGIDPNFPVLLAASLGAGETTALRMTTAYAMLANGGRRVIPTLIDRVQDRHGQTIYRHDNRDCQSCEAMFWTNQPMPRIPDTRERIADPQAVYQMVHILEGVITHGTGVRLRPLGIPLAGKTGTTNDANDTWFMGFTPDLVVGVYVGFDDPRTLGPQETGSSVALPIFHDFIAAAIEGQPVRPFAVPTGIQLVRVNHDTGRLAQPGDRSVILEAFRTGTMPVSAAMPVLDGSAPIDMSAEEDTEMFQTQPRPARPVTSQPAVTGGAQAGGLY